MGINYFSHVEKESLKIIILNILDNCLNYKNIYWLIYTPARVKKREVRGACKLCKKVSIFTNVMNLIAYNGLGKIENDKRYQL